MSTPRFNRRTVLQVGAGLALPTIFSSPTTAFTNEPGPRSVTFGFTVPRTGPYSSEGEDELRAQELAVRHLNGEGDGGMLATFSSGALGGAGLLGRRVEFVVADTQTRSDAARAAAKTLIQRDGAIMINGGSSSGVAIAMQALCQEAGVIFMAGLTHSNDTTGRDGRANGFRHFFNAYMSAAALAPVLERELGRDRRAYHLTADYSWGWTVEESIARQTEAIGWGTVDTVKTPIGTSDFTSYIRPFMTSGADVLVLNHYGGDMVRSLASAARLGVRDKVVNGRDVQIVIPLFTDIMAQGAGADAEGAYGSTNWHWQFLDPGSQAFVRSFGTAYGRPPSAAAHTCYAQVLLYADAVARARSFDPCAVAEALEGFDFDGLGNGPTIYRADDHQCFKAVPVMRGKGIASSSFDWLDLVDFAPARQVTYAPDHPMFAGGRIAADRCTFDPPNAPLAAGTGPSGAGDAGLEDPSGGVPSAR